MSDSRAVRHAGTLASVALRAEALPADAGRATRVPDEEGPADDRRLGDRPEGATVERVVPVVAGHEGVAGGDLPQAVAAGRSVHPQDLVGAPRERLAPARGARGHPWRR